MNLLFLSDMNMLAILMMDMLVFLTGGLVG